jgi:hypothetical protein
VQSNLEQVELSVASDVNLKFKTFSDEIICEPMKSHAIIALAATM